MSVSVSVCLSHILPLCKSRLMLWSSISLYISQHQAPAVVPTTFFLEKRLITEFLKFPKQDRNSQRFDGLSPFAAEFLVYTLNKKNIYIKIMNSNKPKFYSLTAIAHNNGK